MVTSEVFNGVCHPLWEIDKGSNNTQTVHVNICCPGHAYAFHGIRSGGDSATEESCPFVLKRHSHSAKSLQKLH